MDSTSYRYYARPYFEKCSMNSPLLKFLCISITNLTTGAGIGIFIAWSMTAHSDWEYHIITVWGTPIITAILGLLFGWIAYYGIFKQRISYEIYCIVITVTCVITALSAYSLHRLIDAGWLSIYIALPIFLITCFILKHK